MTVILSDQMPGWNGKRDVQRLWSCMNVVAISYLGRELRKS